MATAHNPPSDLLLENYEWMQMGLSQAPFEYVNYASTHTLTHSRTHTARQRQRAWKPIVSQQTKELALRRLTFRSIFELKFITRVRAVR